MFKSFFKVIKTTGNHIKVQNLTRNITALCSPINKSYIVKQHCFKNYTNTSFDKGNLNSSLSQVYSGSHGSSKDVTEHLLVKKFTVKY